MGGNILIEPPIEKHIADSRAHWYEVKTKEGEVVKSMDKFSEFKKNKLI